MKDDTSMMTQFRRDVRGLRLAMLASIIVSAALASAVAWATIPDRGGIIHACYNTTTGSLRVYDSTVLRPEVCGPSEKRLEWNQAGRAGADGVSSAISVHRSMVSVDHAGAAYVPLITADVPAGTYVIVAKTTLADPGDSGADCQLMYNTGAGDVAADSATQSPYKDDRVSVRTTYNLEALVQLDSRGKVFLQCYSDAHEWAAWHSKIILIKVQSATDTEVTS